MSPYRRFSETVPQRPAPKQEDPAQRTEALRAAAARVREAGFTRNTICRNRKSGEAYIFIAVDNADGPLQVYLETMDRRTVVQPVEEFMSEFYINPEDVQPTT